MSTLDAHQAARGTSIANGGDCPWLIVNADDYGYFRCVSEGILEAANTGLVTATGVFANVPHFAEHARWLADCPALDTGVHLNVTSGVPLSRDMQKRLAHSGGRFPAKVALALAVIAGSITVADVRAEWRAQIERCLQSGLRLHFANSHEHIHMLPTLFRVARGLADEYGIAHLRCATVSPSHPGGVFSTVRDVLLTGLAFVNRRIAGRSVTEFLGLEVSGRLGLAYLERTIPLLRPGHIYELMCHPGRFDPQEVTDARLRRYHDWDAELRTLTSLDARELLRHHGVSLVGYRHLALHASAPVSQTHAA